MSVHPYEVGRVVTSIKGHDKGRLFLIVASINDRYVLIADGDTRKLEHPKKKQLKHLRWEPVLAPDALCESEKRAKTADSTIHKLLKPLSHLHTNGSTRADRITDKEEYALVQE